MRGIAFQSSRRAPIALSADHIQSVMTLLANPRVRPPNKLRLAILYALRYQKAQGNQIAQVVDALIQNGVSADRAKLVYVMLNFAGADVRQDDLFMNDNFFSRGKSALKGLKVGSAVVYLSGGRDSRTRADACRVWRMCTRSTRLIWRRRSTRSSRAG